MGTRAAAVRTADFTFNHIGHFAAAGFYSWVTQRTATLPVGPRTLLAAITFALATSASAQQTISLKMQSTWPASNTLQEHFKTFGAGYLPGLVGVEILTVSGAGVPDDSATTVPIARIRDSTPSRTIA